MHDDAAIIKGSFLRKCRQFQGFCSETSFRMRGTILGKNDGICHHQGRSDSSFQEWFLAFSRTFRCKNLGIADIFLGMNLTYLDDGSIILHQQTYIEKLLREFQMDKCKPLSTPAVPLSDGKEEMRTELPKTVPFRQAVGGLFFAGGPPPYY